MEQISTLTDYERFIAENKDKVQEYIRLNDIDFKNIQMSTRVYNILRINGKNCMSDIIFLSADEINSLDMMNKTAADEILMLKKKYLRKHKKELINFVTGNTESQEIVSENRSVVEKEVVTTTEQLGPVNETSSQNSLYYIKSLLSDETTKEKIIDFVKIKKVELINIDISVRSYNALRRGNIRYLHEVINYYPDGFAAFRNVGQKSVDELCDIIEDYVSKHYAQIAAYISGEGIELEEPEIVDVQPETDPLKLTIPQLINHPLFKEKAKKYLTENNISVEEMGLGARATNALLRSNIKTFYNALSIYPDNLSSLRNIGAKSIDEIKARMEYYISKMQNAVSAYCSGDANAMYSDEFVLDTVMSCFENVEFKGISFKEIRIAFPDEFDEARIKKCIGGLLADRKLEYVDFRLYRIYPSVYTVIEKSSLNFEEKNIILQKLNGMTLQEIADKLGVTRERIRQKLEKNLGKLRKELKTKHGFNIFDEDYYEYLYSNYETTEEICLNYLCINQRTYGYLENTLKKGKKNIADALSDANIDLSLKFKINDYLNRNKVAIDDVLIERNRADIEDYALAKLCRDEMPFDDFAERYNELLKRNNIAYDEKLYYTEEVRRTRGNRLAASMHCLWKHGEKLRYYDIQGYDYEELLSTLNLEGYKDTQISTLKFFNDYPDIMKKYDVRDQYELHNLLKKVVDCSKYNDMSIHKQPMIQFGTFDRTQAIYDLIVAFSPITADELAEYVSSEYGYDKATAQASYFQPFGKYYHQGVYSVEFKRIPYDRIEVLKAELPNEFYYISEIKALYKKLFENADVEEINPRSLKSLGYTVFTSYVLKTYTTSDAYFRDVLNAKDVFSLKELKKYVNLNSYTTVLYDMRRNYDILLFEDDQYINFRRIEKLGITKDDVKGFCDEVYDQIDENQYFTIHSLQELEINTTLESLGFDEIFLAGILAMSKKFLYTQFFGQLVFYKGRNLPDISKKSFILYALSKYDSVAIDDFIADCIEEYGIAIPDRYEITGVLGNTDFYYDAIMDKVYKNKNYYYAEFDD